MSPVARSISLLLSPIHPGGNGTHACGVIDSQSDKQHSDQLPNRHYARSFAANLNVGEPRTVRLIYFLPNDRPVSCRRGSTDEG